MKQEQLLDILQQWCSYWEPTDTYEDDDTYNCRLLNSRYDNCQCRQQAHAIGKALDEEDIKYR